MTTLVTQDSLHNLEARKVIPGSLRAYFQQRLYSNMHQLLLAILQYEESSTDGEFCKRQLAKRIEKKPEQITRWLSYPANMTLETISDLLLGMGHELSLGTKPLWKQETKFSNKNNNYETWLINMKKPVFVKPSDKLFDYAETSWSSVSNRETHVIPEQRISSNA